MLGSAEISADGVQDQAHFTQATSLVFHMTPFLLVILFHFSILNSLWLPGLRSALISLSSVLMSFPVCECIPVAEQLAPRAQHGVCVSSSQH